MRETVDGTKYFMAEKTQSLRVIKNLQDSRSVKPKMATSLFLLWQCFAVAFFRRQPVFFSKVDCDIVVKLHFEVGEGLPL